MSNLAHKIKIAGEWEGIVIERKGDQYPIRMTLEPTDANDLDCPVKGTAGIIHPDSKDEIFITATGRFRNGTPYIQIDYVNNDPGIIHFGTGLLELSREGTELEGEFMAISHVDTDGMISGTVSLSKKIT